MRKGRFTAFIAAIALLLTSAALADEAIIDGAYCESYYQSAPSFALRIDGITELN